MESLLSVGCWQRGGGRVQRADTCPADNQVYAFTERGRGLHAETAPSALPWMWSVTVYVLRAPEINVCSDVVGWIILMYHLATLADDAS